MVYHYNSKIHLYYCGYSVNSGREGQGESFSSAMSVKYYHI